MAAALTSAVAAEYFPAPPAVPQILERRLGEVLTKTPQDRNAGNKKHTFTMDVPLTEAEVRRWEDQLEQNAPPPTAPNASFIGGGFLDAAAVLAMSGEKEQQQRSVHKLAPMKLFDPKLVVRMPMTKVLLHRRKWLPYRQRLPVYQCRGPILDALLNSYVLAVVAPPGSGRTLQMPQIISETEIFKSKRLIVVCPTNLSACRTADRLREERGENPTSTTVAVCTSTQYNVVEGTLIAVTTPDMLVRQLLCDPLLLNTGCVIINDMHLRSTITELCFSLLRNIVRLQKEEHGVEKRGGELHIVVDCLEDNLANMISEFFGDDCTARVNLQQVLQQDLKTTGGDSNHHISTIWSTPCVLHLEETIQWLAKCEGEGSFLCRDPAEDLRHYEENIGVRAKIMAAEDGEFTNEEKLRSYWCPIIVSAVKEYDHAERKELGAKRAKEDQQGTLLLPAVVVVVPNTMTLRVVTKALSQGIDESTENEEVEGSILPSFVVRMIPKDITSEELNSTLESNNNTNENNNNSNEKNKGKRLILVTLPIMAQSILPSTLEVGLVVDCARNSYVSYDVNTETNTLSTVYSHVQDLRYRRTIARIHRSNTENGKTDKVSSPISMVVQLIPKSILHSTQHRRISADLSQHSIFHMSWDAYVEMYHLLQAREEGLRCREVTTSSTSTETNNSLSTMVAQLIPSIFLSVPAASTSRYEQLRRTFTAVEHHMYRLGHLEHMNGDVFPKLSPLGVAATCFSWPLAVVRLLMMSRLDDCVIPASVIAATWMIGDIFTAMDADIEIRQLLKEARVFFSRDSGSDVVSAFNAYRMWLSLHGKSEEMEDAFLCESHISKKLLLQIKGQQLDLLRVLESTGIFRLTPFSKQSCDNDVNGTHSETSLASMAETVVSEILSIPEDVVLTGEYFLRSVTCAAYPLCAVPHYDGTVSSLVFTGKIGKTQTTTNTNTSTTTTMTTAGTSSTTVSKAIMQLSIFSDESVMSVEEVYQQHAEKPFLYLHRTRLAEKSIYILSEAIPLCMDAVFMVCGEYKEWPKPPVTRCRGWTSVLTNAWRQTKSARRLPPPAQLGAVSIVVKPYDTIQATPVILQVDDTISFSMRSTTAKWLEEMRKQCHRRLKALLCDKSWPVTIDNNNSLGLQEAWEWWSKRARRAHDWLREERANRFSTSASTEDVKNSSNEVLCPYYQYNSNPGRPGVMVPSKKKHQDMAKGSSISVSGFAADGSTVSNLEANMKQSTAYIGRMPDPVMDKSILSVAQSIAKARSREKEAMFLKTYPDLFAFLHPEHEFHGYYLHILRREAPDLEVLGDDLEELEKFLMELEEEVQREIGWNETGTGTSAETTGGALYGNQTHDTTNTATTTSTAGTLPGTSPYQFQEVNAEEYMASYGMQVETAAEHATKPPSLFKTHDTRVTGTSVTGNAGNTPSASSFFSQPAVLENPSTGSVSQMMTMPADMSTGNKPVIDPTASIGSFTFDKGADVNSNVFTTGDSNAVSGGNSQTLMERLLAMKGDTSTLQTPPGIPSSSTEPHGVNMHETNTMNVGVWPGTANLSTTSSSSLSLNTTLPVGMSDNNSINTANAASINDPSADVPSLGAVPQPSTAAPPTAAELLALLGVIPPSAPTVDPLTIPPPPLPAEVLAKQPPSVLVYPLPPREFGNVPLILAKALGETMGVKVGPTRIVGSIARIEVPNHKVVARALDLKSFICVGKKVHIFKNDRIVDNERPSGNKTQSGKNNARDDIPSHFRKVDYNQEGHNDDEKDMVVQPQTESYGSIGYSPYDLQQQHHQQEQQQLQPLLDPAPFGLKKSSNPPQIGLLTDSEDDDDDDEGEGEESSSSAESF
ncbi:hypothetical protein LSM04_007324 [Trypanosoma melophagium]|uniref:uncharacterized protein n=1 Tax=Trypanosoma melophagium TaxID=715481 RepID=UPI00351A187A|nr:hypothetical protein LSM04_007324 [Trypanosoma melophagium]